MLDTNHNHQPCDFSETLVSYLYGEIDETEGKRFQTHLGNCPACSAEFAGFGAVRSQVAEWRQEEFAPMGMPAIELPRNEARDRAVVLTDEPVSWVSSIRAFFTPQLAFGVAGFAAIVLFAGLGLAVLNSQNSMNQNEALARNERPKNDKVISNNVQNAGPSQDVAKSAAPAISDAERSGEERVIGNSQSARKTKREFASVPANKTLNTVTPAKYKDTQNVAVTPQRKTETLPLLEEEDLDDSLRLADLFAEEDTY